MSQQENAKKFQGLHAAGNPLVLYNIWDAGGAKALQKAGAAAVATGSWSVASAQGYRDGEQIPLDLLVTIAERIVASVDIPVTIDFEGAYSGNPEEVASNVFRLIDAGVVGINFEDQLVGGSGLYEIADQTARVAAIREAATKAGVDFFINARTDIFLKAESSEVHQELVEEALVRNKAYAEAGASGFFVPGLVDTGLIKTVCEQSTVPVNVMMMKGVGSIKELSSVGVSRISYGPMPYAKSIGDLTKRFADLG